MQTESNEAKPGRIVKERIQNNYVLESKEETHRLNFQSQNHNYDPKLEIPPNMIEFHNGQKILDAGCGAGALSKLILEYNDKVDIDAVDFSLDRIEALKADFDNSKVKIRYHQENLMELPFSNSTFDLIFCRFVYQHNPLNNQKISNELYRVLRKNGKFILIDADGVFYNIDSESSFLNSCLRKIKEKFPHYEGYVCKKIPRLLQRSGFQIENIKAIPITFFSSQDRLHEYELWKMRFEQIKPQIAPILGSEYKKFVDVYLDEIKNEENFLYYNKFVFLSNKVS